MLTSASEPVDTASLTAEIVAAFVANNSLPPVDLPSLIEAVHTALAAIAGGPAAAVPVVPTAPTPMVTVRKSITPDYLICLDDGRKFKSLRRHLMTLGMTPDQYRAKSNLPADYPMVAANYAATRSALAKKTGLGHLRKPPAVAESETAGKTKAVRARPRKTATASAK